MVLYASLDRVEVGDRYPVRIMGVINVSPESFYKQSISRSSDAARARATKMVSEGVDIIDIGAMSTAPYLETSISIEEETERIVNTIKAVRQAVDIPISADTVRSRVASEAIRVGATIVNDVTGLKFDQKMSTIVKDNAASLLVMAYQRRENFKPPIETVKEALQKSLEISGEAGIEERKIAVDPGIGFFRENGTGIGFSPQRQMPWYKWDCTVLHDLNHLRSLRRPIALGLSRKSFIGRILNKNDPSDLLLGSLSATAIAVFNGAHMIRAHDVAATVEAVRISQAILQSK